MKIKIGPVTFDENDIDNLIGRLTFRESGIKTFTDCFHVIGNTRKLDCCVYQLGIRPLVPLVDLLYFEYLHYLQNSGQVKDVVIVPSADLSVANQDVSEFKLLKQNISLIFGDKEQYVKIVDPDEQREHLASISILSRDFLETMQYIAGKQFLSHVREKLGLKISSYTQFNRLHPEELRLVSFYVHLVRCNIIWKYLLASGMVRDGKKTNLGVLIWEIEVDKLGFFHRMAVQDSSEKLSVTALMGRTRMANRRKPVPVFRPVDTIYFFESQAEIIKKLNLKGDSELRNYESLLLTILTENYKISAKKITTGDIKSFLKGMSLNLPASAHVPASIAASRVLYYMEQLRDIYCAP